MPTKNRSLTLAIMQPYFFPYLGYFRLLRDADIFVCLDDVQFPRRGWVHRNKITSQNGQLDWLTLPIQKCERCTLIKDLRFRISFEEWWRENSSKYRYLQKNILLGSDSSTQELINYEGATPSEYLYNCLAHLKEILGLKAALMLASEIDSYSLKGEQRIIHIAKSLNATHYINSPGGRNLYCSENFNKEGITLKILPTYTGSNISILERLANEGANKLKSELETF